MLHSQDNAGSRSWFGHRGFLKDSLKCKPYLDSDNPGFDTSVVAPLLMGLQRKYSISHRPGSLAFLLGKLQSAKQSLTQVGPDWSLLIQGPVPSQPPVGMEYPFWIQSCCPSGYHCPQQVLHQPVFYPVLGQGNQPLNNLLPAHFSSVCKSSSYQTP